MCPLKLSLPPFLTVPFCGFLILKLELIRHELFTKWFILLHRSIFLPAINYLSNTNVSFTINVILAVWPLHNGPSYWYFLPNDYTCKIWFLIALLCSVLTPYLHFFLLYWLFYVKCLEKPVPKELFYYRLSRKDVKLTAVYLPHHHHFYLTNIVIVLAGFQDGGASQFLKHC